MKLAMKRWVEKNWGKRCKEYGSGCPCCEAWACFDYLFEFGDYRPVNHLGPLPTKQNYPGKKVKKR